MNAVQLIIVGAQKAGTTSLLRFLEQHPGICTHSQPEMAYFAIDAEYNLGYERAFHRFFRNCQAEHTILLAKHTMLMYLPEAVKRLYDHNPEVQLVVLLRNPIDRAYSAYWYARRMGWETIETFEKAVDTEPARLQDGWFKWRNCAYLFNGTYIKPLSTLLEHFGKEQIHVFLTEELKEEPLRVCYSVFELFTLPPIALDLNHRHNRAKRARSETLARVLARFLAPQNTVRRAIRGFFSDELAHRLRNGVNRLNETEFTPPPMSPETRVRLSEYFEPFNAQLSELLERDFSHWK